jgi:hypothetical protein
MRRANPRCGRSFGTVSGVVMGSVAGPEASGALVHRGSVQRPDATVLMPHYWSRISARRPSGSSNARASCANSGLLGSLVPDSIAWIVFSGSAARCARSCSLSPRFRPRPPWLPIPPAVGSCTPKRNGPSGNGPPSKGSGLPHLGKATAPRREVRQPGPAQAEHEHERGRTGSDVGSVRHGVVGRGQHHRRRATPESTPITSAQPGRPEAAPSVWAPCSCTLSSRACRQAAPGSATSCQAVEPMSTQLACQT